MTRLNGGRGESRRLDPTLGRALQATRRKHHLTQDQLAARSGMSRRHLAGIESGANFTVSILFDLARALPDQVLPLGEFLLVRIPNG